MTAPDPEPAPVTPSPLAGLRAVRQARQSTKRAAPRKTAPRKAPATSRADGAAKRGKYADRIIGSIKTGCALLYGRMPVQAGIIEMQAEPIALAIERVATEDKRVDALLQKVSGFFGKSTAWGELGGQAGVLGAALALSVGAVPTGLPGMAIAFLGGELLDVGLRQAARHKATIDLGRYGVDKKSPAYDATRAELSDRYYEALKAGIPVPGQPPQPENGEHDQAHDEPTQPIADPPPAWAA